jgi:hypothetical protein
VGIIADADQSSAYQTITKTSISPQSEEKIIHLILSMSLEFDTDFKKSYYAFHRVILYVG